MSATLTDATLAAASVEELFERSGALRDGHFLLKSGRHAARYLEKFWVLQHPRYAVEICRRLAQVVAPLQPTLVVGPTTGGVLLAFETARQLVEGVAAGEAPATVRAVFAEPLASGGRGLRRGWAVAPDERVVLVDDVLTTGASLRETVDAVRAAGVEPLAAAVIVDRSGGDVGVGVPLTALGRLHVPSWDAADCILCRNGVALTKPGSS